MQDYFLPTTTFRSARSALNAAVVSGSIPAASVTQVTDAFATAPRFAEAGALLDQWLGHTAGTEIELTLLEDANKLWDEFRRLSADFAAARAEAEALVAGPIPVNAEDRLKAVSKQIRQLGKGGADWFKQAADFLQSQLTTLNYLPTPGQVVDAPLATWLPPDLATSRRTGQFRAAVLDAAVADGRPEVVAFGFGAVAGYTARIYGNTYVNGVVGGPRRSFLYRQRLASRTIGRWVRQTRPADTPSLSELADTIRQVLLSGGSAADAVRSVVAAAASGTYGTAFATIDWDAAARRMVRHLELLENLTYIGDPSAARPTAVSPPTDVSDPIQQAAAARGAGAASSGSGISPTSGPIFGPTPPGPTRPQPIATSKRNAPLWKTILAAIITLLLGVGGGFLGALVGGLIGAGGGAAAGVTLGVAIGEWLDLWAPTEIGTPPPAPGTVGSYLSSADAVSACFDLAEYDRQLHDAAKAFLYGLQVVGLTYPDPDTFSDLIFQQYLSLSEEQFLFRRPDLDLDHFTSYPATSIEEPALAATYPFSFGLTPEIIIDGTASEPGAQASTVKVWMGEAEGSGSDLRSHDRQLDADRGFLDICWQGRVTINPVDVASLPYGSS